MACALARHRYLAELRSGERTTRRTVPIVGVRRRLRALTWMGWSPPELAARLGMRTEVVQRLRSGMRGPRYDDDATVLRSTHSAVAALYDELWDVPSRGAHSLRMRNLARRAGWLPPLAWDDDDLDAPPTMLPHGTHAAFNRHKARHQQPCARCVRGERAYQAARMRKQRAQAGAA